MKRATLTSPWGLAAIVLLTDSTDDFEMGSSPSFVVEETNQLVSIGRVHKIVSNASEATLTTDEGDWTLKEVL